MDNKTKWFDRLLWGVVIFMAWVTFTGMGLFVLFCVHEILVALWEHQVFMAAVVGLAMVYPAIYLAYNLLYDR